MDNIELLILNSSLPKIKLIFTIDDIYFHPNSDIPLFLFNEKIYNLNNGKFNRSVGISSNQNLIENWIRAFSLLIGGESFSDEIFRFIIQDLDSHTLNLILSKFDSFLSKKENGIMKEYLPFAKYLVKEILYEKKGPNYNIHKVIQHRIERKNKENKNLSNLENLESCKSFDVNLTKEEISIEDNSNLFNESNNKISLVGNNIKFPYLHDPDKSINNSVNYPRKIIEAISSLNLSISKSFRSQYSINDNSLENFLKSEISKLENNEFLYNEDNNSFYFFIKILFENFQVTVKSKFSLSKSISRSFINQNCDNMSIVHKQLDIDGRKNALSKKKIYKYK